MPGNNDHFAGAVFSNKAVVRTAAEIAPTFCFEPIDDLARVGFGVRHG